MRTFFYFSTLLLTFFLFIFQASALNIAVAPTSLSYHNLLRDSVIHDQINLFNENNIALTYLAESVHGFVIAEDHSALLSPYTHKAVPVTLSIPSDLQNGVYEDILLFKFIPAMNEAPSDIILEQGLGVKVTFIVSDHQIIDYNLLNAVVTDTEIGASLPVSFTIINQGNVLIHPHYTFQIINPINTSLLHAEQALAIYPREEKDYTFYYNTTDLYEGSYTAVITTVLENVSSSNATSLVYQRELPLELYSQGTFTRQGIFTDFYYDGSDKLLKLQGIFLNNGSLVADAQLVVEVYYNQQLLTVIYSDKQLIDADASGILTTYFQLDKSGDYVFKGKILYNQKETLVKELVYFYPSHGLLYITGNVIGAGYGLVKNSWTYIIVIIIIFFILFVVYKHVRRYS